MLGKKCSTKEAVMVLEAAEVTQHTVHEIDPSSKLITAAIAMRRSEWWHSTPDNNHIRGCVRSHRPTGFPPIYFTNCTSGEINAR